MLASEVRVDGLKTASDCWKTIELIEADYRNYLGGLTLWVSGKEVTLKKSAKDKIDAIERRAFSLSPDEEE